MIFNSFGTFVDSRGGRVPKLNREIDPSLENGEMDLVWVTIASDLSLLISETKESRSRYLKFRRSLPQLQ